MMPALGWYTGPEGEGGGAAELLFGFSGVCHFTSVQFSWGMVSQEHHGTKASLASSAAAKTAPCNTPARQSWRTLP